jgi:hypothetical protein
MAKMSPVSMIRRARVCDPFVTPTSPVGEPDCLPALPVKWGNIAEICNNKKP